MRVTVAGCRPGVGAIEHQRARALGVRGGEQQRRGRPLGDANQHRALDAGRVEHGAQVRRAVLEQRVARAGIGEPGAAAIEDDQPAERGERAQKRASGGHCQPPGCVSQPGTSTKSMPPLPITW